MNLGEFRKLTAHLPDEALLVVDGVDDDTKWFDATASLDEVYRNAKGHMDGTVEAVDDFLLGSEYTEADVLEEFGQPVTIVWVHSVSRGGRHYHYGA